MILSQLRPFLLLFLFFPLLASCQSEPPTLPVTGIIAYATPLPTPTALETLTRIPDPIDDSENDRLIPTKVIKSPVTTAPPVPTASPPAPAPTPTVNYPAYNGPPLDRDDAGIQIHLHREDLETLMAHLRNLGLGWVKTQLSWKIYQPEPDRFDDFRWGELDRLIEAAEKEGIKVMLSVAKAPEWSRPTTELDGPPTDFSNFQAFMEILANRYRGRVAAYELWNEPNLKREWNGMPLSANSLVELIRAGASGVRLADSEAILISAAPATTGINDGLTAIDDRVFLQQMINAGITDIVDVIGAHPYGWANPPDSRVTNPDLSVPSHNDHPSFFFSDTLQDYRDLLDQAGRTETAIWVTEFGWGSYDGLGIPAPDEVTYMAYVDEQQQAIYTLRAYEAAGDKDWLGPLILWNLNFGPTLGPEYPVSAYSVLRPDGSPRPIFYALAAVPWLDNSTP
jgi:hypothetical protein